MLGFVIFGLFLIFVACIYVISPVDLIPEAIFGKIGYLDDWVVGGALVLTGLVFMYLGLIDLVSPIIAVIFITAVIVLTLALFMIKRHMVK